MSEKKLASAFEFTDQELEANRHGKLAPTQIPIIYKRRSRALAELLGLLVAVCAFWVSLIVSFPDNRSLVPAAVCSVALCFGSLLLYTLWRFRRDLSNQRVRPLSGRVKLEILDKKRGRLTIDRKRFRITADQLLAVRDGEYYTVYIAPASRTLLAVEPVDMTEADPDAAEHTLALENAESDETGEAQHVEKPKREKFILGDDGEIMRQTRP